jgi:putative endonuclease
MAAQTSPRERHRERRQRAYRRGRRGEFWAMLLLRLKGYRILARDFRVPMGEVDLIARRRGVLAFVEVKSRDSADSAIEAVMPYQSQRIARAAAAFVGRHPRYQTDALRFDVIVVAKHRWPQHLINAWFAS